MPLPKGLLKSYIDQGYSAPDAMREAWKHVKTQKERYSVRQGFNPKRKRTRHGPRPLTARRRLVKRTRRRRKNPIVVYNPNPGGAKLVYPRALIPVVIGIKANGEEYEHEFKTEVSIYATSDGGLLIKAKSGRKLWARESQVSKYDKA